MYSLFQTDHRDFNNSQTSSYLDLSTLYGDVEEDQKEIRTYRDGKLKPDCFSEKRLLGFPPGCGVLLIMLNRFHNHVVEQLAIINENGRFNKPEEGMTHETRGPSWEKYDEDLFQVSLSRHQYMAAVSAVTTIKCLIASQPIILPNLLILVDSISFIHSIYFIK